MHGHLHVARNHPAGLRSPSRGRTPCGSSPNLPAGFRVDSGVGRGSLTQPNRFTPNSTEFGIRIQTEGTVMPTTQRAFVGVALVALAASALVAAAAPAGSILDDGKLDQLDLRGELSQGARGDPVIAWNANAGEAAVAACSLGGYAPQEARMYAMVQVAVHDALNGIDRRSRPYAATLQMTPGASPDAAVAAASHDVLVPVLSSLSFFLPTDCVNAGIASVEADYVAALDAIPDSAAKTQGIALGQGAADAVLTLRASDGFDTPLVDPNYQEGTAPGEYRYTPGTPFAFAPGLGDDLTPFVLEDSSQFRPGAPYQLPSRKYAADLNEVQRLGGDGVVTPSDRTDEQTEIALFWVERSPLAWNRIGRTVATAEGLDPWESARLFGLLNMAMSDGYVGTWDTKYHYRFWRPVTAIRLADIDGNAATTADPAWTPLLETHPFRTTTPDTRWKGELRRRSSSGSSAPTR